MPSIFSRIVAGEIPAYKIAEDDSFLAFLDIHPQQNGHTLVIPKQEVDNLWNLNAETLSKALVFAQPIAKAIEKAFPCNRCGMAVIGLDVPHAHIHLLPVNSASDMHFKPTLAAGMPLEEVQQKLLKALTEMQ